jgi:ketosteroid isomerase-like protein
MEMQAGSGAQADLDAVHGVLESLQRAMHARDAAAVVALYAPDAMLYDLAPPLGDRPDEAALAMWLASWDGPVTESWRDLKVRVSGDLALCHGYVRVSTRTKEHEDAAWWMRRTLGLTRTGESWRIVHEHGSVPFYMDGSSRAALDLEPPVAPEEDGQHGAEQDRRGA